MAGRTETPGGNLGATGLPRDAPPLPDPAMAAAARAAAALPLEGTALPRTAPRPLVATAIPRAPLKLEAPLPDIPGFITPRPLNGMPRAAPLVPTIPLTPRMDAPLVPPFTGDARPLPGTTPRLMGDPRTAIPRPRVRVGRVAPLRGDVTPLPR